SRWPRSRCRQTMAPPNRGSSQHSGTRLFTIYRKPDRPEMTKLVWHRHSCRCLLPQEGHFCTGRSACATDPAANRAPRAAPDQHKRKCVPQSYPGINPRAKICRLDFSPTWIQYTGQSTQKEEYVMNRPAGVTVIAVLELVVGALCILAGVAIMLGGG